MMIEKKDVIEWSGVVASFIAGMGIAWRWAGLYFVDHRYQTLLCKEIGIKGIIPLAGVVLLIVLMEFSTLKRYSVNYVPTAIWKTNMPLMLALLYYFGTGGLAGIAASVIILAICGGRWGAQLQFSFCKGLSWKWIWLIVSCIAFIFASGGALAQIWSFNKLAMQWFDWGHFYEAVNNTLHGKWFYLNLSHGSFLHSRFCPMLLILAPIVLLQSPVLFLACGSFLIASGAVMVLGISKTLKLSEYRSLILALIFLFLPVTVNLNLPLLDGFHENFLLFPVVLGAWWCYRSGHFIWAMILVLFSFGVRETVGFMWFGWGCVLFINGDRKRGVLLSLFALSALVLIIDIIMPVFAVGKQETYVHAGFYHHLGNNLKEIAVSPFVKPQVFWGIIFSKHTGIFVLMLLTPFIWLGSGAWRYWIPMLPDLLMVSIDSRFDTQTIMRHYQVVPLLVLTIAMLEGACRWKQIDDNFISKTLFCGIFKADCCNGMICATLVAVATGTFLFTQIPGTPSADPRLLHWSNAKTVMAEFLPFIPPKANVSAGPRVASMLVGRNELFFDHLYGHEDNKLQKFVFIESFSPMYGENLLRLKLLSSSKWKLLHSAYLDERLLQLFERNNEHHTAALKSGVVSMKPDVWQRFRDIIPCTLPEIEIRGAISGNGGLLIAVQIKKVPKYDLGLRIVIKEQNGTEIKKFISFGNGVYPACLAEIGEVFVTEVRTKSPPVSCLVIPVVL